MLNTQRTFVTILLILSKASISINALIIVPPSSKTDWEQVASLMVETFDDTISSNDRSSLDQLDKSKNIRKDYLAKCQESIEAIKWNYIEKPLTKQYTYNQYVANARRMIGKKYALYVAKEKVQNEENVPTYQIVGMVEVGMTIRSSDNEEKVEPKATLGVLAVDGAFRNRGIGQQLLEKCQEVVTNIWGEKEMYVQVEPSNKLALRFFKKNAFEENGEMVQAKVARRRALEQRPHLVLSKQLSTRQYRTQIDHK